MGGLRLLKRQGVVSESHDWIAKVGKSRKWQIEDLESIYKWAEDSESLNKMAEGSWEPQREV